MKPSHKISDRPIRGSRARRACFACLPLLIAAGGAAALAQPAPTPPARGATLPLTLQPVRRPPVQAPQQPAAPARPDGVTELAPVERPLALEARGATLARLLTQLGQSVGAPLDADSLLAGNRINLFAPRTSVAALEPALASLYQGTWSSTGSSRRLNSSDLLQGRARQHLLLRRSEFISRAASLAARLRGGEAGAAAAAIRRDVARREPAMPAGALADITAGYLGQAVLTLPLSQGMGDALARTSSALTSFRGLPAAYQGLFGEFYREQFGAGEVDAGYSTLSLPQARLDYRMFYGDRWTGVLMMTRVGLEDRWAEAMLPSILFDLPDDMALYPPQRKPVGDESIPTRLTIDPNTMTWEMALAALSSEHQINILSDSHLRPEVFRPEQQAPLLSGGSLRDLIERVAGYYGYSWWRSGDYYLFRHRYWAEEEAAAVPYPVLTAAALDLSRAGALSVSTLTALAALTDDQLLSLHLAGRAAGRGQASPDDVDLNTLQLARQGLILFAQLPAGQSEIARTTGIPFTLMPAGAQTRLAGLAYSRGIIPSRDISEGWRFRLADRVSRTRTAGGWSYSGDLTTRFEMGPLGAREARLALRFPLAGDEQATSDAGQQPAER